MITPEVNHPSRMNAIRVKLLFNFSGFSSLSNSHHRNGLNQQCQRTTPEFIVYLFTLCNLLCIAFFNKIVYKKTIFLSCEIILQVLDFCQFGKDADNERYNDNIALQML